MEGSVDDPTLDSWVLSWGSGGDPDLWQELARGNWSPWALRPVRPVEVRYPWFTEGWEGTATLRLVAVDRAGNSAEQRVVVHLDGVPPGDPEGLVARPVGEAVELLWDPVPDPDVVGYHVYRDGVRLTSDDIAPLGEPWGQAGGVPGAALGDSPACWGNDDQVPGVVAWGVDFPGPVPVQGVEMRFRRTWYERNGWRLTTVPRVVAVEGWTAGGWQLLASLGDNQSEVRDLSFDPVAVTRVRLRFPAWLGFPPRVLLDRVAIRPSGPGGPLDVPGYRDAWLSDVTSAEHEWSVTAVDTAGNESPAAEPVTTDSVPPRIAIESPEEGAETGGVLEVWGSVEDRRLEAWRLTAQVPGLPEVELGGGDTVLQTELLGVWAGPRGYQGPLRLRLEARDRSGNRAAAEAWVHADAVPPAAPTGLRGSVAASGVSLEWQPPADSDLLGYVVYRNGLPLQGGPLEGLGRPIGSGFSNLAAVSDGDPASAARLLQGRAAEASPWVGVELPAPHPLAALDVVWGSWQGVPRLSRSLRVQVRAEGQWLTVAGVVDEARPVARYPLDANVPVAAVRVLPDPGQDPWVAELRLLPAEAAWLTAPVYLDRIGGSGSDTQAEYRVAAVDRQGNVGEPCAPLWWDATPPTVVLDSPEPGSLLGASVVARGTVLDPTLAAWRLEVSPAGAPWQLVSTGEAAVVAGELGRWQAPPDFAGEALLRLTAWDRAGQTATTEAAVRVDGVAPGAPLDLAAETTGDGVRLTWATPGDGDVAGFRVFRNGVPLDGAALNWGEVADLFGNPVPAVTDGDPHTGVRLPGPLHGVELRFDFAVSVVGVELQFAGTGPAPLPDRVLFEVAEGDGWRVVGLAAGSGAACASPASRWTAATTWSS